MLFHVTLTIMYSGMSAVWGFFAFTYLSHTVKSDELSRKEVPREIQCAVHYSSEPIPLENTLPPPSDPPTPQQNCECVPYYLCNQNRTVSQDGEGIINMRLSVLTGVGLVSSPPYSTCPCSNATDVAKPVSTGVCSNYLDVCCNVTLLKAPPFDPDIHVECGRRADSPDEFPWTVAVLGESIVDGQKERTTYICGGSLIDPSVALTAAHCAKGMPGLTVRVGLANNESQERRVHHVTIHGEYYAGTLYNDIALLFLESPIEMTSSVATICLPQQGENMNRRACIASGKDVYNNTGRIHVPMKKMELPVLPRKVCERKFQSTRLGHYFRLHESFLCAGGNIGQDTCKGDGGSPLVCPSRGDPDVYVQAGIVSWGIGCGGENPGAYVNVAHFRTWIDSHIATLTVDNRFGHLYGR